MSIRKAILLAAATSTAALSGAAWGATYFSRTPIAGMTSPNALITGASEAGGPTPPAQTPDTTPDAFTISANTNAARGALVQSGAITPVGYEIPTAITVSGNATARVSIAGGPAVTSGTISPGQSFVVSLTSSAAASTPSTATVTVGGVASVWSVITMPATDATPDAFTISANTNAARGALVQSGAITPVGYEIPTAITVSGNATARVSIAGGPAVTSGTISPGQSFVVSLTSSAAASTPSTATVTVGGVASTWSVITKEADTNPDGFSIPSATDQGPGMDVTSEFVCISGIDAPTTITVAGDGNPLLGLPPFYGQSTEGTIEAGDCFTVSLTNANSPNATSIARVTVGGVTSSFSSTTSASAPPSCPGDITFHGYGHFCYDVPPGCSEGTVTYSSPAMYVRGAGINEENGGRICIDVTKHGSGACYLVDQGMQYQCSDDPNVYVNMGWK